MREREAARGFSSANVPQEYTRPDGEPFEVILTDPVLITKVEESAGWVWGKESRCPLPPVKGTAAMHVYDKEELAGQEAMKKTEPWKAPVPKSLQSFLLLLGKGSPDVVMKDAQIRDCIRLGMLETTNPPDPTKFPVHVRLSHYGWLWVHQKIKVEGT
jgi:hypothetical protein